MKVAIDLDGTAWAHRELFIAIAHGLKARGHEMGILTAHNKNSRVADLELWDKRGFPSPDFYIAKEANEAGIPTKSWKMQQIKEYKIDYLFDDFDTEQVQLVQCVQ